MPISALPVARSYQPSERFSNDVLMLQSLGSLRARFSSNYPQNTVWSLAPNQSSVNTGRMNGWMGGRMDARTHA